MMNLAATFCITDPAGKVTGIVLLIPAAFASGIAIGRPVAVKVCVVGKAAFVSVICWIAPAQIVAAVGLTVATSGTTFKVATLVKSRPVQGFDVIPRTCHPFIALETLFTVSTFVVAPLNGAAFVIGCQNPVGLVLYSHAYTGAEPVVVMVNVAFEEHCAFIVAG